MKTLSILIIMMLGNSVLLYSQVAVNTDGSTPDNSAVLDIKSNTRGVLLPRMSQPEIMAIADPANGLQVFCTSDSKMYIYVATVMLWKEVAYGTGMAGVFQLHPNGPMLMQAGAGLTGTAPGIRVYCRCIRD
jgi:hypothetical protein